MAKIPLGFHTDFDAQLTAILENISLCAETPHSAKVTFTEMIESSRRSGGSATSMVVREVGDKIYKSAKSDQLFFMGKKVESNYLSCYWTTCAAARLEKMLRQSLLASDSDLAADAENLEARVLEIIEELRSPNHFRYCQQTNGKFPIHNHGEPIWIGDPNTSHPPINSDVKAFPACAGIAPVQGLHYHLSISPIRSNQPSFSDSCGYPYWRNGGRTAPLPESNCNAGMLEVVADKLTLRSIDRPISTFVRNV